MDPQGDVINGPGMDRRTERDRILRFVRKTEDLAQRVWSSHP